jgi:inorganic triphosphatase YgiF
LEIELKLALASAAVPRLLRHPALLRVKRGRAFRARLVATYFDTADRRLAAAGIALRMRREGRAWVQAVKGRASAASGGGLAARNEYEWPMGAGVVRPQLDRAQLTECEAGREVLRLAHRQPLVAQFVTDFVRTTVPLSFPDSTMALAAIDVGHVASRGAHPRQSTIAELELELEAGDASRLYELALALAADLPLAVESRSKAHRGYALLAASAAVPLRAEPLAYAPDATAPAAFAAMLRNALRQIEGNAAGALAESDVEWIHQMRVGVRRLRSALTLARPLLDPAGSVRVVDDLRWLMGELGPARDLDVFVTATLPRMREAARRTLGDAPGVEAALVSLAARAEARRQDARAAARHAIASPRFQHLLLATGAIAAALDRPQPDGTSAADFARAVLKRRHRKLKRAGKDLAAASPGERHAFRIAAKKLRYAIEYFAPCFAARRVRDSRQALADLQEALGALNDDAVAAALAAQLAEPSSHAASLFAAWSAAQEGAHLDAAASARKRFAATSKFWTGRTRCA